LHVGKGYSRDVAMTRLVAIFYNVGAVTMGMAILSSSVTRTILVITAASTVTACISCTLTTACSILIGVAIRVMSGKLLNRRELGLKSGHLLDDLGHLHTNGEWIESSCASLFGGLCRRWNWNVCGCRLLKFRLIVEESFCTESIDDCLH